MFKWIIYLVYLFLRYVFFFESDLEKMAGYIENLRRIFLGEKIKKL